MLELNSETFSEYAAKHLAQINTGEGVIEISWIARRKEILCKYQGRYYRGQNEQIGTTVATLMNCSSDVLVPSELMVYEEGTGYEYGTERQLKDLLECEWSDYACDKMAFICFMFMAKS
jgi:hypothetical protein